MKVYHIFPEQTDHEKWSAWRRRKNLQRSSHACSVRIFATLFANSDNLSLPVFPLRQAFSESLSSSSNMPFLQFDLAGPTFTLCGMPLPISWRHFLLGCLSTTSPSITLNQDRGSMPAHGNDTEHGVIILE